MEGIVSYSRIMHLEQPVRRFSPEPEKNNRPRKIWRGFFLILIAGSGIFFWLRNPGENSPKDIPENQPAQTIEIPQAENETAVAHQVAQGDLPADLFSEYGKWDANDTAALLEAGENIFDLSKLTIGREIRFYFNGEERAQRLEYEPGTEKIVIAERSGDNFSVRSEKINYEISQETARGQIDNFFYADALEAGLQEPTVLEVGDIFSFSIDFATEIRQGDEFVFVYEKRKRDGKDAPDGKILAAKFVNEGVAHYAYYFDNSGQGGPASTSSSLGGYYDGEGRVLERQFLKAPLSYRRITSGFTGARFHPITRTVSAHYQIDYAAPTGTPVSSTARGTVASAGWEGGWGNMVRIRHDNGYTTHYGHLSAFAKGIRSGTSVSQGQVIGYVGSTGWSTGPHLDYGMKLDGSPVNPLKLDQPKGAPLDASQLGAFEETKNSFAQLLN